MTDTARHSVSVAGAVIDDSGRALAIRRRDNGRWELPGGILELGEILHDGLRREVREETCLDAQPDALTGIYQNLPLGVVAFVFRCHAVGGRLGPTDEASELAWLTPDEITTRMTEAFAIRLLDALNPNVGQPHLRQHDGIHLLPAV